MTSKRIVIPYRNFVEVQEGMRLSIFCGWFLFRMYQRFCEVQGWKLTVPRFDIWYSWWLQKKSFPSISGGWCSTEWWIWQVHAVHRVQAGACYRVFKEEFHTSRGSVAVLPENGWSRGQYRPWTLLRKSTYCLPQRFRGGLQWIQPILQCDWLTILLGLWNLPSMKNLRSKTLKKALKY